MKKILGIRPPTVISLLLVSYFLLPQPLSAYGGPGSVISGIGALLAAIAMIGAALFGFVWFPLKRLIQKFKGAGEADEVDAETVGGRIGET